MSTLHDPIRHATPLALGQSIVLDAAARAALELREVNVSEAFTLTDARGAFFRASRKSDDQALVYEAFDGSPESPARITLFCAVLGRQRMIQVTQKAAELGCVAMVPVITQHSVQRGPALEKEKPWAWRGQSVKGSRQCRRASVMRVSDPLSMRDALAMPAWKDAKARFFLDDRSAGTPLVQSGPAEYALFVGPEGGFSDDERTQLVQRGAQALRLGSRVLRAETAVFAGLTVLQHRLGDMS